MYIRLMLLLGLVFCLPVKAGEVSGLYEVEVIARSQNGTDHDQAVQFALMQVMQRIMLGDGWREEELVQAVLAKANSFVRDEQSMANQGHDPANPQATTLRLLFDEQKLLNTLRNSPQGVWNEIRPETLVWLVVEYAGQQQVFSSESMPLLQEEVQLSAAQYGLPLILPTMEKEHAALGAVPALLAAKPKSLEGLASRYEAVSTLVASLVHRNGCWLSNWTHYFDEKVRQWSAGECQSLQQALAGGMHGSYLTLADYYGAKPLK